MRLILGATVAVAALALASCADATEPTAPAGPPAQSGPTFQPGACSGDYAGVANKIECGTLTVDETRGGPSTRRVALPVTIVRASAPKPGAGTGDLPARRPGRRGWWRTSAGN